MGCGCMRSGNVGVGNGPGLGHGFQPNCPSPMAATVGMSTPTITMPTRSIVATSFSFMHSSPPDFSLPKNTLATRKNAWLKKD